MSHDKQLSGFKLRELQRKQRLDQALNAKEFALLAGVSYSTAREWLHMPGFPTLGGLVFWQDFVLWRRLQTGLETLSSIHSATSTVPGTHPRNHETVLGNGHWPERGGLVPQNGT
jgi:hypothetical protein